MSYAGATGRMALPAVAALDPRRWAAQPKVDGQYVELHLDGTGRVARVHSRSGAEVRTDLVGCLVGAPGSVLVGELEAHTERGLAAAQARGWQCVHLFDVLRVGARDVTGDPYRERRDWLHRMRIELEQLPRAEPLRDAAGRVHDRASGRYVLDVPRDWRRAPIVEQRAPGQAQALWDDVVGGGGEGLVVVSLDAPVGRRGSKRKVKPRETIDARVVELDSRSARLLWERGTFAVARGSRDLAIGQVWSVHHEGCYATGEPRFARLDRCRADLAS